MQPPRHAPVRLIDVANRAGVALSTASRVLNNKTGTVRPSPAHSKVLLAAQELGYQPNAHARALASSQSNLIGLVVHDISDPYFAMVAGAVVKASQAHNFVTSIVPTYRNPQVEAKNIAALSALHPRAIIMAGSSFSDRASSAPIDQQLARYADTGGTVVSYSARSIGHVLDVGNECGGYRLGEALVGLGHREFAIAGGPRYSTVSQQRIRGFRAALRDHGITLDSRAIVHGDISRESGRASIATFRERSIRATCIFGAFELIAVGVQAELQAQGITIPDQVSVAGFSNLSTSQDVTPAVTTWHIPLDEIGQAAVDIAWDPSMAQRYTETFMGEVVLRASTAAPPIATVRAF